VTPYLLEISVQTVAAALAAERGGARRIELCANLDAGGLTPSQELMRQVRNEVRIPIFAMIRPRAGDFVYSPEEIDGMKRDIDSAQRARMDGIVLGLLTADHRVDIRHTQELVKLAQPLPVTFHRAFDVISDQDAALEDVIETRAARILTSGGAAAATAALDKLARLVAAAQGRIAILPGGGINASNISQVTRRTGAHEFHSGLGSVLAYGQEDCIRFENEVRALAAQLANAVSRG
jgi:copper homeostasis protein